MDNNHVMHSNFNGHYCCRHLLWAANVCYVHMRISDAYRRADSNVSICCHKVVNVGIYAGK